MVISSFLVGLQLAATPVKKELSQNPYPYLKISRQAIFWNIPTHVTQFSKCRTFSVMLLKGDFKRRSPNNFKKFCKIQQEPLVVESVFSTVTPDLMSDFNASFHENLFLITEWKMLRKMTSCESLENFQENVCDGVYSSEVANL